MLRTTLKITNSHTKSNMAKASITFKACHRLSERSFHFKGKQFPVCARCTGLHFGYLSLLLFLIGFLLINFWISVLMIIPTYLDGFTQAYCNRQSNNYLRLVTGIVAGVGEMSIISKVIKILVLNFLQLL